MWHSKLNLSDFLSIEMKICLNKPKLTKIRSAMSQSYPQRTVLKVSCSIYATTQVVFWIACWTVILSDEGALVFKDVESDTLNTAANCGTSFKMPLFVSSMAEASAWNRRMCIANIHKPCDYYCEKHLKRKGLPFFSELMMKQSCQTIICQYSPWSPSKRCLHLILSTPR